MTSARTSRFVALPLALLLALAALALPSGAQPSTPATRPPQESRADARARQRAVDAQLDVLHASEAELQARLGEIDGRLAEQQAILDQARVDHEAAENELAMLMVDITEAENNVVAQRERAEQRAVAAYMHPRGEGIDVLLGTDDLNELHEKNVLIRQVAEYDRGVLADYRAAEAALEKQRVLAEDARRRSADAQLAADAAVASLASQRAEQETVREALTVRIAEFEQEADALAAEEAQLTSLIAARQAEARRATTTTAPPPPDDPQPGPGPSVTSPPTTRPPTSGALLWPVNGVLTSPFGWRWGRMHSGIDIGASTGTPIKAADSGYVFFAGVMGGYGNVVLIDHGRGITTLYAHQSQIQASSGQSVSRGQVVGLVGSTGHSTGPHLHFEVRVNGSAVNPLAYLP